MLGRGAISVAVTLLIAGGAIINSEESTANVGNQINVLNHRNLFMNTTGDYPRRRLQFEAMFDNAQFRGNSGKRGKGKGKKGSGSGSGGRSESS
jgi:hypothetical protein